MDKVLILAVCGFGYFAYTALGMNAPLTSREVSQYNAAYKQIISTNDARQAKDAQEVAEYKAWLHAK